MMLSTDHVCKGVQGCSCAQAVRVQPPGDTLSRDHRLHAQAPASGAAAAYTYTTMLCCHHTSLPAATRGPSCGVHQHGHLNPTLLRHAAAMRITRYQSQTSFVACSSRQQDAVREAPRDRIIAIDLGTHGSGIATTKARDSKPSEGIMQHGSWPDQPCPYPKARSAMLYRGRTPVAWGWSAKKLQLELSPSEQSDHWYVEDFKLALQDEDKAREIRSKGLTPEQVMADYLQLFIRYTKQELRKSGVLNSELEQPQWCLTVPAMWSESSKSLMRRAALRAGLIRTLEDEALKIILEPEAAALYARDTNAPPLRPGMVVCILDVGGGTADNTVHEVVDRGGWSVLAEAVSADGAMCGSQYVDQAFTSHYHDVIGHTVFDNWVDQHPAEWRQAMDKWITCKHNFTGELGTEHLQYRLPIPPRLLDQLPRDTRDRLSREQGGVTCPDVVLDSVTVTSLFSGPVTQVIEAAKKQLKQLTRPCDVVILVGGFAQSPYLQTKVRTALVDQGLAQQLVVPPLPYTAVMNGAALYGCDPAVISARRSRMAYGIRSCVKWQQGAPQDSKFIHKEDLKEYSNAKFVRFVAKNELVNHNQVVSKITHPLYLSQLETTLKVYATDNNDLEWLDDELQAQYKLLAKITVENSDPGRQRDIRVDFAFGQTELKVTAWDLDRQEKVRTTVKFAQQS